VTTTTATKTTRSVLLGGRSPLLRLQSDERLIVLLRAGNDAAFEILFGRYRTRLLGFCRHMLGSREDAEDVLQEVFANAYNAILADQRDINVRPWLYRIARNRCLNHLRRPTADASDTMDEHMDAHGRTAADVVHRRADVRHLLEDVQKLAESQRTALLLREIDALSYDQIAEAMETTIPSVKSLLVRARMSLAEAAEARQLSCDDVRRELAEVSEGLKKASPALRRHVRDCEECRDYRTQLRKTTTAMALALPIGPLMILKKLALAKIGGAALAGGGGGAAAGGTATGAAGATGAVTAASTAATGVASTAAAGGAAGSLAGAGGIGMGAVASKAVAGVAVTAVIAGGAVEAKRVAAPDPVKPAASAPAKVKAPAVNPTGGASLSGAPAALTEPAQQAAEKPAEASTADPEIAVPDTGATGETGATSGGVDGEEAVPAEEPAPVTGSDADAEAETGGAAIPAVPEPQGTGTTGATGSSVGLGTTGSSASSP
jgi:RNA polymerase sigma factor (sigma-70 family)